MLSELKQIYQAELIKVGVSRHKAEKAAQNITLEQLNLIAEVWLDWAKILNSINPKS